MAKLLLYFVTPMAIVNSFYTEYSLEKLKNLGVSFILATVCLIVSMSISGIIFRKAYPIENFGAAFSNAGFIGIPLVQATMGVEAIFYISGFIVLLNILQWTYGVNLLSSTKGNISLEKVIFNPALIAFIVGIFIFLSGVHLPLIFSNVIKTSSTMNGPLAMIVLGSYLCKLPFRDLILDKKSHLCVLVRLVFIPAVTIVLLWGMKFFSLEVRRAVFIVMAAPVGANVAMFAQMYGREYVKAVNSICLSTILCIFTIPLIFLSEILWKI